MIIFWLKQLFEVETMLFIKFDQKVLTCLYTNKNGYNFPIIIQKFVGFCLTRLIS